MKHYNKNTRIQGDTEAKRKDKETLGNQEKRRKEERKTMRQGDKKTLG